VVQKIADAILSVNGVQILDRHSDLDHNRTVLTLLGEPGLVEEAIYNGSAKLLPDRYWTSTRGAPAHWRYGCGALCAYPGYGNE
jgi:glutamate formiminotransferase